MEPDAFFFNSKSANQRPGSGIAREVVADPLAYTALPLDFRRVLSNFYPCALEDGGQVYASVEHAFHARKLRACGQPELAARFAKGSGRYVGADPASAKRAGGRRGLYEMTADEVARWADRSRGEMVELWRRRVACDANFAAVLRATGRARLIHYGRRMEDRWVELEAIRAEL